MRLLDLDVAVRRGRARARAAAKGKNVQVSGEEGKSRRAAWPLRRGAIVVESALKAESASCLVVPPIHPAGGTSVLQAAQVADDVSDLSEDAEADHQSVPEGLPAEPS